MSENQNEEDLPKPSEMVDEIESGGSWIPLMLILVAFVLFVIFI